MLRLCVGVNRITHACYAVKDVDHAERLAKALLDSFLIEDKESGFQLFDLEEYLYDKWLPWQSDIGDSFYEMMTEQYVL